MSNIFGNKQMFGGGQLKLTRVYTNTNDTVGGNPIRQRSVNIKTLLPTVDYTKLTLDNFRFMPVTVVSKNPTEYYAFNVNLAYNPTTGILSWQNGWNYGDIYYIYISNYYIDLIQ